MALFLFMACSAAASVDLGSKLDVRITRNGEHKVVLDWSGFTRENFTFIVYQNCASDNKGWRTISTFNFETTNSVRVLNVYPDRDGAASAGIPDVVFTYGNSSKTYRLPKSAAAKVWMEGGTIDGEKIDATGADPDIGRQVLLVDTVSAIAFNADPSIVWNYDVLFIGTWDCCGHDGLLSKLTPNTLYRAIPTIKSYIEAGYGVLAGHDCISGFSERASIGLSLLRDYFNIKVGRSAGTHTPHEISDFWRYQSDTVALMKKGLLSSWPHVLTTEWMTIPLTHTLDNAAFSDVWFELVHGSLEGTRDTVEYRYFLTTNNNTAMIQTGHSGCRSTADERKIIANTLYYLKQRTKSKWMVDNSIFDFIPPRKPTCSVVSSGPVLVFACESSDVEEMYSYRVTGTGEISGEMVSSNVMSVDASSGISHFSYWADNRMDARSDLSGVILLNSSDGRFVLPRDAMHSFMHILAVDRAGNTGPITTVDLRSSFPSATYSDNVSSMSPSADIGPWKLLVILLSQI